MSPGLDGAPPLAPFVPFAYGFRPFFLAAGWYALIAIGVWALLYSLGVSPFGSLPPHLWHGHEMLFGFVTAAIAGFMLTAVPSWTGGRGFAGWPLVVLTILWLAGRLAFGAAGWIPLPLLAVAELAFLPALAAVLAPSLSRSASRNRPLLLVLLALWATDASFVFALWRGDPVLAGAALRTALNIVLLLITVIGGRIVPSFTSSALRKRGIDVDVRVRRGIERLVIGGMIALVVADLIAPHHWVTASIAAAVAAVHAWRMLGWQGMRTIAEPIVWVLHAAYLWLPIGLALKAVHLLSGAGWAAHWMHALSVGAAAAMILAVMTRAALGHTGRPLTVGRSIAASYVLLVAAAIVRVFGPGLLPFAYQWVVGIASLLWIGAFLIFAIVYTPILIGPRADGKPG
jgi:uncharacterized protein involved in response to NO